MAHADTNNSTPECHSFIASRPPVSGGAWSSFGKSMLTEIRPDTGAAMAADLANKLRLREVGQANFIAPAIGEKGCEVATATVAVEDDGFPHLAEADFTRPLYSGIKARPPP
jgi:hypothetical protein